VARITYLKKNLMRINDSENSLEWEPSDEDEHEDEDEGEVYIHDVQNRKDQVCQNKETETSTVVEISPIDGTWDSDDYVPTFSIMPQTVQSPVPYINLLNQLVSFVLNMSDEFYNPVVALGLVIELNSFDGTVYLELMATKEIDEDDSCYSNKNLYNSISALSVPLEE